MESLVDVLKRLGKQGYVDDLFSTKDPPRSLSPEEYYIDKVSRVDESSDPQEQVVVYAISSPDCVKKWVAINGFGVYSDPQRDKLISKLKVREKKRKAC